jgi:transcription termination factor NusB
LSDDKLEDSDIEPAPKLIEAVLQNCHGHVDQWLEPYLRVSIERLRKTEKHYLKDLLMEVVRLSPNPFLEKATSEHLSAGYK